MKTSKFEHVLDGDYEAEIARRMWCAALAGVDDGEGDDSEDEEESEELRCLWGAAVVCGQLVENGDAEVYNEKAELD